MRGLLATAAVLLSLAGCATPQGMMATHETADLAPREARAIAADLTAALAQRFGPGQTRFVFAHPDKPLGAALEAALREAGYAVDTAAADSDAGGTRLRYGVDALPDGQRVVQLAVGPDYRLNRLYRPGGTPASALTVLQTEPPG